MSLSTASIVDVSISVTPTFPEQAGFGTLLIVTKDTSVIGQAERVRQYSNMAGVSADWNSSSEAYKAANSYFSQNPRPTKLLIGVRFESDQPAQLRGGASELLSSYVPITDGTMVISLDDSSNTITNLNFSSNTTLSEVASTVQTALRAVGTGAFSSATCTHDGTRFLIETGTTGSSSSISFATTATGGTDVSELLHLEQGEATKTNGIASETITNSLTAIERMNDSWYGLLFTKEVREKVQVNSEDAVLSAAAFCQSRTKTFFNTTNDLDTLDTVNNNHIAALLETQNYDRTITIFSTHPKEYPSASLAARAFTVDYNGANTTITLKFKKLPGISTEDLDSDQKSALDGNHVNVFVDVGGSPILVEGYCHTGRFYDEVQGIDWLQNKIETNVFNMLVGDTTKTAFTNAGIAQVENEISRALDSGERNGLIASGYTTDGDFLPLGYKVNVPDISQVDSTDKSNRHLSGVTFTAIGAGAIHSVQISGSFEK